MTYIKIFLGLALGLNLLACSPSPDSEDSPEPVEQQNDADRLSALTKLISEAKRVPTSSSWFEVIKLPNQVYAFWEPGHSEKVNAFLIIGKSKDLLYDTGMGIGKIGETLVEVRKKEGFPDKELMVVNSHNHLDHNGGNKEFDLIWTYNHPWAIQKLTQGVPSGEEGGFIPYWDQMTPQENIGLPSDFDIDTFSIPPYPEEQIRFLVDGDIIDLGDRRFTVIHTESHSPDGIALYDEKNKIFFGGDAFYGSHYLSRNLELLEKDLKLSSQLDIDWHYSSHGAQLIEVMQHGYHLRIIRKMMEGEGKKSQTQFAGLEMPMLELDGVVVTIARDILLY